ncbi:MAG: DUF4266 domain-containing protein [Pseudomonadales bacterium]|nr:DUF4266 domain-containing protein [Pseudomonadales bacterium]
MLPIKVKEKLQAQIRLSLIVFIVIVMTALSACSHIKPWVKPYERSNLADNVMKLDRDPVNSSYLHHVYQAREGARGAEGGAGGGCGCN